MRYIVMELQTSPDGSVAHIVDKFDDKNTAESKFHAVLSFASVSSLPSHGCMLLTSEGDMLRSEIYHHVQTEDEEVEDV